MKAKEVIAVVLGAMQAETTRTINPHAGNDLANIEKIVAILDVLPDTLNVEMHVEVKPSGEEDK
jgi:biotin synthase-related radical SAM superfamily protein